MLFNCTKKAGYRRRVDIRLLKLSLPRHNLKAFSSALSKLGSIFRGLRFRVGFSIQSALAWSLNQKFITSNRGQFFLQSWGEEQQLVFVVLPERKIDDAMLNST